MNLIEILLRAKPLILESPVINALWIEGSYATGRFNETSDLDTWIDITPGEQQRALSDFKQAVSMVKTLRNVTALHTYSVTPKLVKSRLYIDGHSDENRIELDIQEATRRFKFDRMLHDLIIMFDKTGAITYGS